MKSKGHAYVSFAKSAIRLLGCVICVITKSLVVLAVAFGIAEVLGVVEELVDRRG